MTKKAFKLPSPSGDVANCIYAPAHTFLQSKQGNFYTKGNFSLIYVNLANFQVDM
jgi:hypothetical protein